MLQFDSFRMLNLQLINDENCIADNQLINYKTCQFYLALTKLIKLLLLLLPQLRVYIFDTYHYIVKWKGIIGMLMLKITGH